MSKIHELFSTNLKAIRKEKKMSQQAIADKSDMLASTVNRIENMKVTPSIDTVERIANALEVDFIDLFQSREISDKSIVQKLQMINSLSKYNRNVIELMIDTVLEKSNLENTQQSRMKKRLEELKEVRKK